MQGFRQTLLTETKHLHEVQQKLQPLLQKQVEGKLMVSTSHHYPQYYLRQEREDRTLSKPIYLPRTQIETARDCATREYAEAVEQLVNKRQCQLQKILKDYRDDEIEAVYQNLAPARQELVTPIEIPWEQFVQNWIQEPYTGKGFEDGTPVILTNRGLRVRSKSEKIIADYLDSQGILYRYECPLKMNGYGTVYPDFTILSMKYHKIYYWEHEGRMDDPAYLEKAIRKLNGYAKQGILPGENLILTYETNKTPIDMKIIELFTKQYLL